MNDGQFCLFNERKVMIEESRADYKKGIDRTENDGVLGQHG